MDRSYSQNLHRRDAKNAKITQRTGLKLEVRRLMEITLTIKFFTGCKDSYARRVSVSPCPRVPSFWLRPSCATTTLTFVLKAADSPNRLIREAATSFLNAFHLSE